MGLMYVLGMIGFTRERSPDDNLLVCGLLVEAHFSIAYEASPDEGFHRLPVNIGSNDILFCQAPRR